MNLLISKWKENDSKLENDWAEEKRVEEERKGNRIRELILFTRVDFEEDRLEKRGELKVTEGEKGREN